MYLKALVEKDLDKLLAVLLEQRLLQHRLVHVQLVRAVVVLENLRESDVGPIPVQYEHEVLLEQLLRLLIVRLTLEQRDENVLVQVVQLRVDARRVYERQQIAIFLFNMNNIILYFSLFGHFFKDKVTTASYLSVGTFYDLQNAVLDAIARRVVLALLGELLADAKRDRRPQMVVGQVVASNLFIKFIYFDYWFLF